MITSIVENQQPVIPVEKHTSLYKIFFYYIDCQLPAYALSEHREQLIGHFKYHDKKQKAEDAARFVCRRHTAAELAEYHDRGVEIIIDDPAKSIQIYEWIVDYLAAVRDRRAYRVSGHGVSMEDIRKLDSFAATLYPMARSRVTEDLTKSKNMRRLDAVFGSVSRMRRTMEDDRRMKENDPRENVPLEHISIHEQIAAIKK